MKNRKREFINVIFLKAISELIICNNIGNKPFIIIVFFFQYKAQKSPRFVLNFILLFFYSFSFFNFNIIFQNENKKNNKI